MADAHDYLRLAVDPIRLAVLGTAVAGPTDSDALANKLGVPTRKVHEAIGKLREAGLLTAEGGIDRDALQSIAQSLPQDPVIDPELIADGWTEEEATVLSRFFSGRRLTEIPSSLGKRRVVLDRMAQEFEPGLRYREKEVNFTLQMFHADYAALRRYLVDEGFLARVDGVYWRTGGRL